MALKGNFTLLLLKNTHLIPMVKLQIKSKLHPPAATKMKIIIIKSITLGF